MTRQVLIGMLVCSAMILGAMEVHGQNVGPGRWWRSPDIIKYITLSDKEKQVLDEMFIKNRNVLIDLRTDLEKERLKLEDILDKEPLDQSVAKGQFKRIEEKRQKLSSERFRYILEVRKLLGQERFRILSAKFEEMKMRRHERSGSDRWSHGER